MIFGKIDYLNLLPFHVFLKGTNLQSSQKAAIEWKKGVPSKLCGELKKRRVDAAVISSVEANLPRFRRVGLGICAFGDVKSVLVRKNSPLKFDPASRTSNALARLLGLNGEVLIGDRALKALLSEGEEAFFDLANEWKKRHKLPFVFGILTLNGRCEKLERLAKKFVRKKVKIPRFVLESYAKSRGVSCEQILWYLGFIYYKMEQKEWRSLRKFYFELRNKTPKMR